MALSAVGDRSQLAVVCAGVTTVYPGPGKQCSYEHQDPTAGSRDCGRCPSGTAVPGRWKKHMQPGAKRRQSADMKRRARAVAHVARQLGVTYPARTRFAEIASPYWHSPPQRERTVLSASQGGVLTALPSPRPPSAPRKTIHSRDQKGRMELLPNTIPESHSSPEYGFCFHEPSLSPHGIQRLKI